jgi:hypothetical protein
MSTVVVFEHETRDRVLIDAKAGSSDVVITADQPADGSPAST